MNCPVDGTTLTMTDRQGIEIDYCPKCRGVWLDRGELDKIIERSSASPEYDEPRERRYVDDDDDRREGHGREGHGREGYGRSPGKKRKSSILGDLFDFG